MKPLAIAGVNLRRILRDKVGLFFIFVFPFMIILAIGAAFGAGFNPSLGVVAPPGELADDLVARLEALESPAIERFDGAAALLAAVERGTVAAGLILPDDYDEIVRSGGTARAGFIARPAGVGQQLRLTVAGALDEQGAVLRAAAVAAASSGEAFEDAVARASRLAGETPQVSVQVTAVGEETPLGRFDVGAAQQLVLFVFVTSLSASGMLVESRRLGVSRRMLSTATSVRTVLAGETLGRYGIALLQGLLIVGVSAALLGVQWGDPLGAGAIVLLFCLVGTGAGMLLGAALSNAQQAGSLGVFFGLGLAALGGSMVPLEVFPDAMRVVARATPHAWANDAFAQLLVREATAADIAGQLAVLAAYGFILLGAAVVALRRSITR